MKGLLLAVIFVFGTFAISNAQTPPIEENLYYRALHAALEKRENAYSKYSAQFPDADYRNVIVELELNTTAGLPNQIGLYKIQYVYNSELRALFRAKKQKFQLLTVSPIQNDGSKLIVPVSERWISIDKKSVLLLELEGGTRVTFSFDCESKAFVISDVHLWGI